jgi:uncharacterized protein (DUF2235 family)
MESVKKSELIIKKILDHYTPGDKIFLIGYSRGAFEARSLVCNN